MANKLEELKKDIAELENLEKQATRRKVKDLLSIEIRKFISEVVTLEEQAKNQTSAAAESSRNIAVNPANRSYEVKINNYAWDQTSKFVKFYVTLKNVHNIPPENIKCEFTRKSLELTIKNLDNKDYVLKINNLLEAIEPELSNWKVKSDMVIVNAAKREAHDWSHVTELEKKSSDAKKLNTDTEKMGGGDPMEGLMSLMKNMYEKGDDDMKRTIAKAWTESQEKGAGPAF